MPHRSVDIIRKRSERLGAVSAPNEKEALAKAIKLFETEPTRSNRIHCHQDQQPRCRLRFPLVLHRSGCAPWRERLVRARLQVAQLRRPRGASNAYMTCGPIARGNAPSLRRLRNGTLRGRKC